MPPKPTKQPPQGLSPSTQNVIYELAMRRPKGGFAASPLFRPSSACCPKCGGDLFTRIRFGTVAVLGIVCDVCPWTHTYSQTIDTPPAPTQMTLFDVAKNSAAACVGPYKGRD